MAHTAFVRGKVVFNMPQRAIHQPCLYFDSLQHLAADYQCNGHSLSVVATRMNSKVTAD